MLYLALPVFDEGYAVFGTLVERQKADATSARVHLTDGVALAGAKAIISDPSHIHDVAKWNFENITPCLRGRVLQ
jgi:hypothetical protein